MLKLVKLNLEIEKLLKFDVEYNYVIQNFLYNHNWVTDISLSYFERTSEKIEKLIDDNLDYTDEANVLFIENLLEDISSFSASLNTRLKCYSSYDFSSDDWSTSLVYPNKTYGVSPLDFPLPSPSNNFEDRGEYVIEIIKGFFNINDDTLEVEELSLDDFLIKKHSIEEEELQVVYAKAHLTYILALHERMVQEIELFLKSIIKVYNRRKSSIEENLSTFMPEGLKLEFNISKTNLGHLFYNLYEIGVIANDKADVRDERTNLKNYLNHANLFYLGNNSKYEAVARMTRAMPVQRDINENVIVNEIVFLESLITKLSTRVGDLEEKKKKVKGRY